MMTFNIAPNETPDQAKQRADRIRYGMEMQSLLSPPRDTGSGMMAVAQALSDRQDLQGAMFPAAPGGAKPDWATGFRNLFTLGNNGGLY